LDEKIIVQSQRLYVRTWKPSDLDAWHQVVSHPRTNVNRTEKEPWSREQAQSWLEWHIDHRIGWEKATFNCPLILRATDQFIGSVGLNPFLEDENIPEIEWTISPEHWGKGYATEIGRAMVTYGFEVASFPAIMGFAPPQHKASRRVMEKIGMTYLHDKEYRGHILSFYRIEQHH
jgi:ribosomal-protein-alanine N-acetyltransferase